MCREVESLGYIFHLSKQKGEISKNKKEELIKIRRN